MSALFRVLIVTTLWAATAEAQSINVSFGHADGGPSSTYAAAGAAGVWNTITGTSGPTFPLVAIDGSATSVTVSQSPTTTFVTNSDPTVTGDDAALLNSGLDTSGAETCLFFNGFQAGTYEVLIYAWLPLQPTVLSRTRQDEAPSTIDVGGTWTGAHAPGVTYARYVVTVTPGAQLLAHSGLAMNLGAPNAALNGIQIRPLASASDGGAPVDAGSGSAPDAGSGSGQDAGTSSGADAGSGARPDAGSASGNDAGTGSSHDAGASSGMDAGTTPGPDAGAASSADAGANVLPGDQPPPPQTHEASGGCATSGGLAPSTAGALLMLFWFLSRRRRQLQRR